MRLEVKEDVERDEWDANVRLAGGSIFHSSAWANYAVAELPHAAPQFVKLLADEGEPEGVALGFYVSFSGILTFKNSPELREIGAELPPDRLLVETDAPYLAPGKYRGKRNEPAHVGETARVLAEVRGLSFETLSRLTTENFHRLFSKASQQVAAVA